MPRFFCTGLLSSFGPFIGMLFSQIQIGVYLLNVRCKCIQSYYMKQIRLAPLLNWLCGWPGISFRTGIHSPTKSIVFLLKATTKYISNIIMFAKQKNELGPSAESRTPNCEKKLVINFFNALLLGLSRFLLV